MQTETDSHYSCLHATSNLLECNFKTPNLTTSYHLHCYYHDPKTIPCCRGSFRGPLTLSPLPPFTPVVCSQYSCHHEPSEQAQNHPEDPISVRVDAQVLAMPSGPPSHHPALSFLLPRPLLCSHLRALAPALTSAWHAIVTPSNICSAHFLTSFKKLLGWHLLGEPYPSLLKIITWPQLQVSCSSSTFSIVPFFNLLSCNIINLCIMLIVYVLH